MNLQGSRRAGRPLPALVLLFAIAGCSDGSSEPGTSGAAGKTLPAEAGDAAMTTIEPPPPALSPAEAKQQAESTIDANNLAAELEKIEKEIDADEKQDGGG